jgi:iron complex transport system substrate-binding protein
MRKLLCVIPLLALWIAAALPTGASAASTIHDDLGRTIALPHPIKRIVSLAPSITEILFAVGAGDKVVGDTVYCDYPEAAKRVAHVGGMEDPNEERIVSLRPDLVMIASESISAGEADRFSAKIRIPVYITAAHTYEGVIDNVQHLGALCGKPERTAATVRQMRSALAEARRIAGTARPKSVFVVVWSNPLMTASGASFIGDLVRLTGGRNVAESLQSPYPSYSPEALIRANPDYILIGGPGEQVHPGSLDLPWARTLTAVRAHRIIVIPSDWTDRPGPRLRFGLLAIANLLRG